MSLWLVRGKGDKRVAKRDESAMKRNGVPMFPFRLMILASALWMAGFGIYHGEAATVLAKAVEICLECIGIG